MNKKRIEPGQFDKTKKDPKNPDLPLIHHPHGIPDEADEQSIIPHPHQSEPPESEKE